MGSSVRSSKSLLVLIALSTALVLGLSACGGSDESTSESSGSGGGSAELTGASKTAVCDGKALIEKGLDQLKAVDMTEPMGAVNVTSGMDDIRKGITAIMDEYDSLSDEQRVEVKAANEEFTSSFTDIGFQLADALPKEDAQAQKEIDELTGELSAAYEQAYGSINCS